jgi:hypothetical protein
MALWTVELKWYNDKKPSMFDEFGNGCDIMIWDDDLEARTERSAEKRANEGVSLAVAAGDIEREPDEIIVTRQDG